MLINEDWVFFYGTADWPSNFHPSPYVLFGYEFHSVEQGFQWHKAVVFKDRDSAEKILDADQPADCKRLGRLVKGFKDEEWDGVKDMIMSMHVNAKLSQHQQMYREGLELYRDGKRFVEASKKDKYWGVGAYDKEASRMNPNEWVGQNRLGRIIDCFFAKHVVTNPWYQSNWSWYEKEIYGEVSEEESNNDFFIEEEEEEDEYD